jgi:hypothetical protein
MQSFDFATSLSVARLPRPPVAVTIMAEQAGSPMTLNRAVKPPPWPATTRFERGTALRQETRTITVSCGSNPPPRMVSGASSTIRRVGRVVAASAVGTRIATAQMQNNVRMRTVWPRRANANRNRGG